MRVPLETVKANVLAILRRRKAAQAAGPRTMSDLAAVLGGSPSTLNQCFMPGRGSVYGPGMFNITAIAAALGVDEDELLSGDARHGKQPDMTAALHTVQVWSTEGGMFAVVPIIDGVDHIEVDVRAREARYSIGGGR